jgi:asparagine synthase (glutamine-hydrolysing)
MAHSREVRLPFLNHELVSFVFSLPSSFKIGHGYTKLILRQAMKGKLPDNITLDKRKTGFEPPQRKWMEHESVKEYAHEAKKTLVKEGILNDNALLVTAGSHDAYDKDASEWRWMIAGQLMNINKKGSE